VETVLMIAGMALVTFGTRYLLLPLSGHFRIPVTLQRALRFVPPAVLTAIIVPAAIMPDGTNMQFTHTNAYLVGAVLTVVIACASKNLLITIVGGMAGFLFWQWVLTRFF
jgi:branched-subunit amino acid transport protein